MLLRAGYPPAIIARADHGQDGPLANLVGRAVERTLTLYLEATSPQIALPPNDEWLPLREAAESTPYSQEYLSLLARTGRLEAIKRGRNWYTTRRAMAAYRTSVTKT